MTITRIRPKADIVYGASKTRKTSNIGLMALYVYKKYGRVTRMMTNDGGGYDPVISLVNEGIIIPWVPIARKFTISLLDLACQGWWPKDPEDPESPLVPPSRETWEQVGAYAIEGLTSNGDAIIRQFKADKAHLSQDPSFTYTETPVLVEVNGKLEKKAPGYSGGNMAYYGAGQDMLYDFVLKSHMLPCEKVLWTALEGKGEEDGSRAPTYGPAIIGRKAFGKTPQWFGNCVHIEQLVTREAADATTKQSTVNERPVMYLRTHCGTDNVPYPCGTRAPFQMAEKLPVFLDPPDISELYRRLDVMTAEMDAQIREMKVSVAVPSSVAEKPPNGLQDGLQEGLQEGAVVESVERAVAREKVAASPSPLPPAAPAAPQLKPQLKQPVTNTFVPPRISIKKPT